jgi:GH24 family phage-related lysozyme (muramidase)
MNKLSKKSEAWVQICKDRLKVKEGYRAKPYLDTKGKWTCFYGINLETYLWTQIESRFMVFHRTKPREIAEFLLDNHFAECGNLLDGYFSGEYERPLSAVNSFYALPDNCKVALVDMCYNMGFTDLMGFERMLMAIDDNDWDLASIECIDSKYGRDKDTRSRAKENASLLLSCKEDI